MVIRVGPMQIVEIVCGAANWCYIIINRIFDLFQTLQRLVLLMSLVDKGSLLSIVNRYFENTAMLQYNQGQ